MCVWRKKDPPSGQRLQAPPTRAFGCCLSDCVCGGRLWAPFLCFRCGRCARCAFPFRVLVLDSASHASRLCSLRSRTRTHSHTRTRARRHSWPSRHSQCLDLFRDARKHPYKECVTPSFSVCLYMVVSRCRGIGPPSVIPSSGLCFCWLPIFVVIQLPPTRVPVSSVVLVWPVPRGVSVIPRAVSLRVSISRSTGILGIPLPALLSNIERANLRASAARHHQQERADSCAMPQPALPTTRSICRLTYMNMSICVRAYIYIYVYIYIYTYLRATAATRHQLMRLGAASVPRPVLRTSIY